MKKLRSNQGLIHQIKYRTFSTSKFFFNEGIINQQQGMILSPETMPKVSLLTQLRNEKKKEEEVLHEKISPLFNQSNVQEEIRDMIRVNQAGEFGAQRIYEGQLAVLKGTPDEPLIEEMKVQEIEHLDKFNAMVRKHRVRPTVLEPFWYIVGYGLGFFTAAIGREGAMMCTAAVEEVIGEHYNDQLRRLHEINTEAEENGNNEEELNNVCFDPSIKQLIKDCRDDELEHLDIAMENNAERAPFYNVLSEVIKGGTKTAIWLSTRI